jgi:splicing factor U2AF subunit
MAKYGHAAIGGAEHLARIHGTEEDKVNCPFYYKIGACRHGDKCSRQHHRPAFSQTILIKQMYTNPYFAATSAGGMISSLNKARVQLDFDEFYEEVYEELRKHGSLEGLYVCDNVGDHMVGNVYAKFEVITTSCRAAYSIY